MRVILMHGWGADASIWDALCAHLPRAWSVERLEAGYFGAPARIAVPPAPTCAAAGPVIAVGHSLGALWWLSQAADAWDRLLCINGFPRFCAAEAYAPAVDPRVLARMRQRFAEAPSEVLQAFCARAELRVPASALDLVRLAGGLEALATWDARLVLKRRAAHVVALSASDDPIVPPEMTTMAFAPLQAERLVRLTEGGHALPLQAPARCAEALARLVAEVT